MEALCVHGKVVCVQCERSVASVNVIYREKKREKESQMAQQKV
jgi:hypothetical protein